MSRITRKELKSDKFALEVEHTVTLFEEHHKEILRYGGIVLVVVLLALGYSWYSKRKHTERQDALARAIQVQEAPVGAPSPGQNLNFPNQEVKEQAAIQAFQTVQNQYSGSEEAMIAEYYVGSIQADQGKLADAEKSFKDVVDHADAKYASLAKLSLGQVYFASGNATQGEAVLRGLIQNPTAFVSTEQATIALARLLAPTKPAESRKLLEPLRSQQGAVGQVALSVYNELPPQ